MVTWNGNDPDHPEPWQHDEQRQRAELGDRAGYGCGFALSIVGLLSAAALLITGAAHVLDQLLGGAL